MLNFGSFSSPYCSYNEVGCISGDECENYSDLCNGDNDFTIEVTVINIPEKNYSTLEVNCPDQPGILASVGKILASNNINLKDARIATLGERVEDLFQTRRRNRVLLHGILVLPLE